MYNSNGSTPAQMETANQYQVMRFITKDTQWCIWFTVSHDKHFKSHLFGHLVKRCKQLLWCLLVKCRVIQVLRCHAQEFGIEFFQPHFPFRKFVAKDLDVCNAKILHIHRNGHWWWSLRILTRISMAVWGTQPDTWASYRSGSRPWTWIISITETPEAPELICLIFFGEISWREILPRTYMFFRVMWLFGLRHMEFSPTRLWDIIWSYMILWDLSWF